MARFCPLLLLSFTGQASLLHCYTQISLSALLLFQQIYILNVYYCLSEQVTTNTIFCVLLSCFKRLLWLQVCVGQRQFGDYVSCRHTAPCPAYIPLYYISLSFDIIIIAIIYIYDIALFFTIQDTYKPTARRSVPLPKALQSPSSLYPFNQNETQKSESIMPKPK